MHTRSAPVDGCSSVRECDEVSEEVSEEVDERWQRGGHTLYILVDTPAP